MEEKKRELSGMVDYLRASSDAIKQQNQELEQGVVVVDGHTPFFVVVIQIDRATTQRPAAPSLLSVRVRAHGI